MTPADRLRELIAADPRPDREIADAAGVKPAYLSNVKTGRKADVELASAAKILRGLNLDWSALGKP